MLLTFKLLREVNVRRCEEVFHKLDDWSPTDWATAVAGEAGEACNKVKKLRRLDGGDQALDTTEYREMLADQIAEELADTVIYCDLLAARIRRSLSDAVVKKFNEVSAKRGSSWRL